MYNQSIASPKQFDYDTTLSELTGLFGDRLKTASAVCEQYGKDESFHPSMSPHAVIQPENAAEVQAIVKICNRNKTPIIPYGVGTSLEGNIAALKGAFVSIAR